ncbi:MAG: hypothetical protein AAF518_00265 [Spirochaetota bacterium]
MTSPKKKLDTKRLQKQVFARIFPLRYLKFIVFSMLLLLVSPFLLFLFYPDILKEEKLLNYIIVTISTVLVVDITLLGFLVIHLKLPYFQEWKDKLGYIE